MLDISFPLPLISLPRLLMLQLNPESAGLFTCISNQHKMSAVFLGQVH